jgi:ferric-dicitrate binding protein FerR (iron transport regulator)
MMDFHGSDGIPRRGHEDDYATQLWLGGPSAFWLHPEGPLSETTPAEWLAMREKEEQERAAERLRNPYANMAAAGLSQAAAMQAFQNNYLQAQMRHSLGGVAGFNLAAALFGRL